MKKSEIKEEVRKSVIIAISHCGTQDALAKKAGITQGAIGKYLRGEALPTITTANGLSDAVDGTQHPSCFAPHIYNELRPDA